MKSRLCHVGLVASLLAACGGSAPDPAAPPAPVASPPPSPGDTGEPTADAEQAPPPGPSFDELLAAALACPTFEDGSFDTCEALETWGDADQPAFAEGKANGRLLALLADEDPKKRILAALQLRMTLHEENLDAKTANALIDALARERTPGALEPIAAMVTQQNLGKVGKLARVVEVAKAHPAPTVRVDVMLGLSFGEGARDPIMVDWALDAARDESSKVRNAALALAANNTTTDPVRACKLVNDLRRDADHFVRPRAHLELARRPACKEHFGALVADLEKAKLADYGKDQRGVHFEEAQALRSLCRDGAIDATLRPRVTKAAERIATAKAVGWNVRVHGLEAVDACDAAAGKALATRLASDPDAKVSARARELAR